MACNGLQITPWPSMACNGLQITPQKQSAASMSRR
jgi:hypothetical protein